MGLAMDLSARDLDKLEEIARRHYDTVLRYTTFIHCHNMEKSNEVD